jgi:Amt family ammonium transporter
VTALVLGKRMGYPTNVAPPHNLPFAVLGTGILWFGWFGFNAGSALGAGKVAGAAFTATHLAGAAAGLTWALIEWIVNERPTMLGLITGAVAGLAAVTPAAGFVRPLGAVWIGIGAAAVCYATAVVMKAKLGYDDTLDAFGVHGVGGVWGTIAAGIFATKAVNPAGADGLLYGNPAQLWIQLKAAGITVVWSLAATWVLLKAVDAVMGLRASEHEERVGLDLTGHRESAYTLLD